MQHKCNSARLTNKPKHNTMKAKTIERINNILEASNCGQWELEHETTLYLPDAERLAKGYDCITYYRGGYGYPEMCFVKERIESSGYGAYTLRVSYATPSEFLALLKTQHFEGGMWRTNNN